MRLSEEQYAALQAKSQVFHVAQKHRRPNTVLISQACAAAKASKYKNVRCVAKDGTKFGSKLELRYYERVILPQFKAGEILWFVLQPSFRLEGGVRYRADFLVVRRLIDGMREPATPDVIDVKGVLTKECKNKLKMMKDRYGIDVELVRKV
jgi:hypothetical protein